MKFNTISLCLIATLGLASCSDDGENGINGTNGTNGTSGTNGFNSLIQHQALTLGDSDCFFGGLKIQSGLDTDNNNELAAAEITSTSLSCNVNPVSNNGSRLPYTVLRNDIDDGAMPGMKFEIRNGGFGSDMVAHPTDPSLFYAVTDRGPNATFTGAQGKGKIFPTPDYTPRIGLFKLQPNGDIKKIKEILFKRPDGTLITGLPNDAAFGGTGETPYNIDGTLVTVDATQPYDATTNPIKLDNYGLDAEGIVALSDGTFWVSDEYGPHIVHFDADGKEIGRINAFSNDTRNTHTLPAEFANRRANRGMEGLAITPDESTLVGIMQSTLYNPSSAVKNLDIVRIVTVEIATGNVAQYLYKQEKNQNSQSGIVALSNNTFLVIERDGAFYNATPTAMKHLYKIDLTNATNIEAMTASGDIEQDPALGLTIAGETLEQVVLNSGWTTLENAGINPVSKTMVSDLVAEVSYPHDKLEGIWLIDNTRVGVINDDDFATWATGGVLEQKYLDAGKNTIDGNTLYIIENLDLGMTP
ncbi:esterase-like activity of phytase family protein [Algibacillus agarilyticus]|uniref:esterase-like activity of phytase family protein n=1 Tax=Algibacillus agarilyticus TaxID=2234133 RepID=UPI000DCFD75D|nr:esterase-like activity of phytase family protein [Algibacillus agarilyticus]